MGLLAALARRGADFEVPDFDSDLRELDFAAELLGITHLPSVRARLQCRGQFSDDKSSNQFETVVIERLFLSPVFEASKY
ncbi:MAG: hypothetical protein HOG95_14280 [Rhodospirillaceae bacterium]|nr:hypothetical protein [Rhodospirillaceae bacterium]MBT5941093.1 hypothetical protein [Rhodospirillaceae bacterium]